ncbi:hypothetical protein TDE_0142 [Treponema denticola ATCC 35405]|uniref:Uncharacterized protein n=1 Tax=Treponema denticola (strain ATCC 35405 / DSM 14222 / CIP 103919 / JCM 8153 / KCTC 15104) TaxID=243275 RepID=Q73RE7_TREDE|nr:hypothetical protein TDE_0142 [Treponema denticola ATCC 35405]
MIFHMLPPPVLSGSGNRASVRTALCGYVLSL